MKQLLAVLTGLTVLLFLVSCSPTYESKGDDAYRLAQKSSGSNQRILQKKAYMFYEKAFKKNPTRVNNRTRNRFIEMTILRAKMVLTEGSSSMDAIPLFIEQIDSALSPDVAPEHYTNYALFLAQLADSNLTKSSIYKGIGLLEKAIRIAPDKTALQKKMDEVIASLAEENFEIAKSEYEAGVEDKNPEALVRAEYRCKLSMYYKPDYPEAQELLSKVYALNVATYSAYKAVVTDRPDTTIYRKVDNQSILLAISSTKGNTYQVNMYNYSFNPLRLKPEEFFLVDDQGNRVAGLASSKIEKEILEQEHEIKMTINFPSPKGKVKKLVYETADKAHYSEKNLF